MAKKKKPERTVKAGGDVIMVGDVGAGAAVAAGRGASAVISASGLAALKKWRAEIESQIDSQPDLSDGEKKDIKDQVAKIQDEAAKGKQADAGRLEKLINTLAVMGPDIFEVAMTTLVNPLGGVGLALKKIGDKAKVEREAKESKR